MSGANVYGAITIDTNAADIQPNGVRAAGNSGQAADAKHVHASSGSTMWVSVLAFGADPTGGSDSTASFQNALATIPTGGVLYVPSGSYKLSGTLTVVTGITIQGDGDSGNCTINQTSTTLDTIAGSNVKNFVMRNIRLQGPSSGTGNGINLSQSIASPTDYVTLEDCRVRQFGGDGVKIDNPIVTRLTRVISDNNGGNGFNINGAVSGSSSTSVVLSGCYAISNGKAGYELTQSRYSSLVSCASDHNGTGYRLSGNCENVTLLACGAEACMNNGGIYVGNAFEVNGCSQISLITPMSFSNIAIFIWVTGSSQRVQITAPWENTPSSAVNSVKVDSGSSARIELANLVTAPSYAGAVTGSGPADWLNVVDLFGADPTGSADATTAIGNAVAYGTASGQPVYIPAGTYKITAALNWKLAGLVVIGAGSQKTKIVQHTANTAIIKVAGQGQRIQGMTLTYASQEPSANTASNGIEFGDDSVGSCFESIFEDLYVQLAATGLIVSPGISTGAGLFSCAFRNIHVLGYSIGAITLIGNNGGGASNCTGCVFDNIYVHNNFSGSDTGSTSWPVRFEAWDELVINQLNIEHAQVFLSDALLFSHVGNAIVNSLHFEHLEMSGTPGWGLVALGTGTGMVKVNALSVRFCTFTGGSYNSIARVTAGSGQTFILDGLNFPTIDGGGNTVMPIIDFNSATNVSAQVSGINANGPQTTESSANAGAGCSGVLRAGTQVTYFPQIPWTVFATGGTGNTLNTSSGFSTTMVAGTIYYAALLIPFTVPLTGIQVNTAGAAGTDKWIVALYDAAGNLLANSALAGTNVTASTNAKQQIPFTSPYTPKGPAAYLIGLQSNGTTAKFLSFQNAAEGFVAGTKTGNSFGTLTLGTPASTYTVDVGPEASTY